MKSWLGFILLGLLILPLCSFGKGEKAMVGNTGQSENTLKDKTAREKKAAADNATLERKAAADGVTREKKIAGDGATREKKIAADKATREKKTAADKATLEKKIAASKAVPKDKPLVEKTARGEIDWTSGTIRAKGKGVPPPGSGNDTEARATALRAAVLDASRNLLSVAQDVRITSPVTVGVFAGNDDPVMAKIENMIMDAAVVDQEYIADGTVAVTVELSLSGGFAQLVLPKEIRQIEAIKPIYPEGEKQEAEKNRAKRPHTGIVVDMRGGAVVPALFPRILDENGREVYGSAFVSREFAVQQRVSGYARGALEGKSRVGDNPLNVKGLRPLEAGSSDIVISNADAARLLGDSKHLEFMKQCRVVILVD